MSRPILAPLVVALSTLLVVPQIQAEPTAPLFVVEQQRSALVARLAKQWSGDFAVLPGDRRLTHEQLSGALFALRADRLFAVTLAGDAEAVEAVLGEAQREVAKPRVAAKALGDPLADLTYTPINPCRILDTRSTAAGPLAPNVARTFDGYSTNFASQGGTGTSCGVPNGVAALAMNVYAVNPTNLGFIKVWPANGTEPDVSTVNYQVGITAIATGTLVPVDAANSNRFTAKSPASVDFIVDVVGYFKPPGGVIGDITTINAGVGLTGGGSSGEVTVEVAGSYRLPQACTASEIAKWNGSAWACAADVTGGGVGTVTQVNTGTGLTGGPINTTGTISVLDGGIGSTQLANAAVITAKVADAAITFPKLAGTGCSTGEVLKWGGSNWSCGQDFSGPTNAFIQGGNAFGTTAIVGSTDPHPLEVRVNGARALRLEPPNILSPNILAGSAANGITGSAEGVTIGGGGWSNNGCYDPTSGLNNRSCANLATGNFTTIGGGVSNAADAMGFTGATVAGGAGNTARGRGATVAGGWRNRAIADDSAVGGGFENVASGKGAMVSGGAGNAAIGDYATVPGGNGNEALGFGSFAAGTRAITQSQGVTPTVHDGTFVFADSNDFDFNSAAQNEFAVRSTGGVRFVTSAVAGAGGTVASRSVSITPQGEMLFPEDGRQAIRLRSQSSLAQGIGGQPFTTYFRSNEHFAWFRGGSHSEGVKDPGGGQVLATLSEFSGSGTVTGQFYAAAYLQSSDRSVKTAFRPIDPKEILKKVAKLPISTWSFNSDPATRHIGPVSQDFVSAFGVGRDDKSIATVDADGVALAAVQGLHQIAQEKDRKTARLEKRSAKLERELAELKALVQKLTKTR